MGRLFEVLRQPQAPRRTGDGAAEHDHSENSAATDAPADPSMPFIEVGPRHLLEGSPDVLASVPARPSLLRAVEETPTIRFLPFPHAGTPGTRTRRKPSFAPELVAFHAPKQAEAHRYRDLLAAILRTPVLRGERSTPLLFCPASALVSATTIVLNLGITAAQEGKRTIVVDGSLSGAVVAGALGLPVEPGLRDVLSGAAGLDEALQATDQDQLFALTAGIASSSPGARFIASTMRSLLRELRECAEYVFVDGPVWDGQPQVLSLASAVEGMCLVLPETEAETAATDTLLEGITRHGIHLAGCVLATQ
jgi:hypothetical protein